MVPVDAADTVDIKHLVTQLLLQILPTSTAERGTGFCNPEAQHTSISSEVDSGTGELASRQLDLREQAGCDLWDMTRAGETARVAVQHAALEILPKVAMEAVSHNQPRMAELLTGALANILCHSTPAEQLQAAQQSQLQQDVLSVTYSTTDAACLAEAFRLLTTALKGPGSHEWLRAMLQNPRSFLQHLVWIADNTLNATLLERSLDLLLAITCSNDQAFQQTLEAGTMPVIISAITTYADSVGRASALQRNADSEAEDAGDRPSSSNNEVFSFVPTPSAVLTALSLCQVLAQERDNPLFHKHSSTLCGVAIQLLNMHELLHSRASMQGLLVLLLACMDSSLWLDSLLSNAVVLEAVFEVLVDERGFEEKAEEAEALQAQEAAWAVLAAVSRHVATADVAMQCLTGHVDALTSNRLAEISPDCAKYVQTSLLQALHETGLLQDSEQHKAQEALELALQTKLTHAQQGAS